MNEDMQQTGTAIWLVPSVLARCRPMQTAVHLLAPGGPNDPPIPDMLWGMLVDMLWFEGLAGQEQTPTKPLT